MALSAIVSSCGTENLTRNQIGDTLREEWDSISTTIELDLDDGGTYSWDHFRLDKLLVYIAEECVEFQRLLVMALAVQAVLSLVLYADEVTPGNPLAPDNQRKYWAIYVSIVEFGSDVLSNPLVWLPIAVIRSAVVKKVKGGLLKLHPTSTEVMVRGSFAIA